MTNPQPLALRSSAADLIACLGLPSIATQWVPLNANPFVLDIGGEGRYQVAWNLNPRAYKTIGPARGQRIPRHIPGRADEIPLAEQSVDIIVAERTPLRRRALAEIERVMREDALIILRHACLAALDPHRYALECLPGIPHRRTIRRGKQLLQETTFVNSQSRHRPPIQRKRDS